MHFKIVCTHKKKAAKKQYKSISFVSSAYLVLFIFHLILINTKYLSEWHTGIGTEIHIFCILFRVYALHIYHLSMNYVWKYEKFNNLCEQTHEKNAFVCDMNTD